VRRKDESGEKSNSRAGRCQTNSESGLLCLTANRLRLHAVSLQVRHAADGLGREIADIVEREQRHAGEWLNLQVLEIRPGDVVEPQGGAGVGLVEGNVDVMHFQILDMADEEGRRVEHTEHIRFGIVAFVFGDDACGLFGRPATGVGDADVAEPQVLDGVAGDAG
jgi:hypothetical protein